MEDDKKKCVTYRQNPNIDFLFGYFGDMPVPTKQDGYKPIDAVEIDENQRPLQFKNLKNIFKKLQQIYLRAVKGLKC